VNIHIFALRLVPLRKQAVAKFIFNIKKIIFNPLPGFFRQQQALQKMNTGRIAPLEDKRIKKNPRLDR